MRRVWAILLLALTVLVTGCLGVVSKAHGEWGTTYSGTQYWAVGMEWAPDYWPLFAVDLPCELVFDTAVLPIDLLVWPFKGDCK